MMAQDVWHGVLIDAALSDRELLSKLTLFARRASRLYDWTIYGITSSAAEFEQLLPVVQQALCSDAPVYAHFYNDERLVVVFPDAVLWATTHASSWRPLYEHAARRGMMRAQLDLFPNRFQDELHYFSEADLIEPTGRRSLRVLGAT